jgi:hypothetical protein
MASLLYKDQFVFPAHPDQVYNNLQFYCPVKKGMPDPVYKLVKYSSIFGERLYIRCIDLKVSNSMLID